MWHPFRAWREERAKDRETLLAALSLLVETQNRQADVAIEQSKALRTFIDSYMTVATQPIRRVMTDEAEYEAEQQAWGVHGES